jgi:hypothetical protein
MPSQALEQHGIERVRRLGLGDREPWVHRRLICAYQLTDAQGHREDP